MTKEEQNAIIKQVWTEQIRKETAIPEDIARIYKNWVLSKVQQSAAQLQQPSAPQGQEGPAPEGQGQKGQAPDVPAEGGK